MMLWISDPPREGKHTSFSTFPCQRRRVSAPCKNTRHARAIRAGRINKRIKLLNMAEIEACFLLNPVAYTFLQGGMGGP